MVLTYHRLVICEMLSVTCFSNDNITYDIIVTGGIRVSVTQPSTSSSMEYRVAIWSFSIFSQKCPKIAKFLSGTPDRNMIGPVIFAGALTSFAGALPPWAPPW